jgi:pimeloyl-ACP methyl ester carboxylesterase
MPLDDTQERPRPIKSNMPKIRVNGIELAYDDTGSGQAVVFLHGYPFNRSLWRDQVAVFSGSHRVITPDLRGHGDSGVAPATMEEMARDVEGLMTSLGIRTAVVGGLSMGGYVTLAFYRLFPERVRALVLADTRATADTEEGKQNRAKQSELALREGMNAVAEEMLPKLLCEASLKDRPEIVERVRRMIVTTRPQGAVEAQKAMAARYDHTSLLSQVSVPALIVVGRHDAITPAKDSEQMHREIAGSLLEIIEDAGHVSNLEQPDKFNQALLGFVKRNATI